MPTARKTDQRIRSGTWTSSGLGTAYAITALADQSDMGIVTWEGPAARLSRPVQRARISTVLDMSRREDGFLEFDLGFSFFTFGMLGLWYSSFLPAGVQSAAVTVMHYDDQEVAKFVQCLIYRPTLPGDGKAVVGGWGDLVWKFREGVQTS